MNHYKKNIKKINIYIFIYFFIEKYFVNIKLKVCMYLVIKYIVVRDSVKKTTYSRVVKYVFKIHETEIMPMSECIVCLLQSSWGN